jgi:hypothetical protein
MARRRTTVAEQADAAQRTKGSAMKKTTPKPGDLRVWWIPQVPGKAFRVPVESPAQAAFLLSTLADYDLFQLANNIKPDFCNAGGLECFSQAGDDQWCEWYDVDTGAEISDWGKAA